MAHFRARIQGHNGEASRLGTKESGLFAEINGWEIGVRVKLRHTKDGDYAEVYLTRGSNHPGTYRKILHHGLLIPKAKPLDQTIAEEADKLGG